MPVRLFEPASVSELAPESVRPLVVPAMFPLKVMGPLVVSRRMVLVAERALPVLMPPESRALSVPPAKTMPPSALVPSIPAVSATRAPTVIVVGPVKALLPERTSVPVPYFASPAVLLAAKAEAKVTVWLPVSMAMGPVLAAIRDEKSTVFAAVNWSVPPPKVRLLLVGTAAADARLSVPASIVTVPVKALLPERTSVPAPFLVSPPVLVAARAEAKITVWPLVSMLTGPLLPAMPAETSTVYAAVNWSVPPPKARLPPVGIAPALAALSTPPLMAVVPV